MREKKCAKCGACTAVCPVYRVTGKESLTARGKLHLLKHLPRTGTRNMGHILSQCLLCGACRQICPRELDPPGLISLARGGLAAGHRPKTISRQLAETTLTSPQVLTGAGRICATLLKHLPASSGLWLRIGLSPLPTTETSTIKNDCPHGEKANINYFRGCLATYLQPEIATATANLGQQVSGNPPYQAGQQTCCGLAAASSGNQKAARKLARQNIQAFADNNLPILTSCASCYNFLKKYQNILADDPKWASRAENFSNRVQEFSTYFCHRLTTTNNPKTAPYYHDPCHLRFNSEKITTGPRKLIESICNHPPKELPSGPACCGNGGLFRLNHPQLASQIAHHSLTHLAKAEGVLVTSCSGCLLQWRQNIERRKIRLQVKHLAVFINEVNQAEIPSQSHCPNMDSA